MICGYADIGDMVICGYVGILVMLGDVGGVEGLVEIDGFVDIEGLEDWRDIERLIDIERLRDIEILSAY